MSEMCLNAGPRLPGAVHNGQITCNSCIPPPAKVDVRRLLVGPREGPSLYCNVLMVISVMC